MISYKQFLINYEKEKPQSIDRVIALLWFFTIATDEPTKSVAELCTLIEKAGFSKQNISRIKQGFIKKKL